jgi:hypothetical protein
MEIPPESSPARNKAKIIGIKKANHEQGEQVPFQVFSVCSI